MITTPELLAVVAFLMVVGLAVLPVVVAYRIVVDL